MSYQTLHNTITTHCRNEFELKESIFVLYDNSDAEHPIDREWVRFSIKDGTAQQKEQASVGSRTFRRPGVVRARINTLLGEGDSRAMAIVDLLVTVFRAKAVAGVVFRAPSPVSTNVAGKWWQTLLEIPFWSDTKG